MKLSYHYNPETFILDGVCDTPIDPAETLKSGVIVYMPGANTTFKEPLEDKPGYSIVFNKSEDKWEYQEVSTDEPDIAIMDPQSSIKSQIADLEDYLYSTDWYAIRYADSGAEIPADIKLRRSQAREDISRLREQLVSNDQE